MVPLTIQQAFDLAVHHHRAGELAEAEQLYRQILAKQPQHADAMQHLGLLAQRVGQKEVALDLISRAVALNPGNAQAQNNLGIALKENGQLEASIAAYRRAIALRPDYAEAHVNLGNALAQQGQLQEAIGVYRQAVALKPNLPQAHSHLGAALSAKGQLDDAIDEFCQAIVLRPGDAETRNRLGSALGTLGHLDEAVAAYREAIAIKPDYAEAHVNLAIVLRKKGELNEAVAAARQALIVKPDYAEAYFQLGNALAHRGEIDEGVAAFRRSIELRPDYVEAHSALIFMMNNRPAYDARAIAEELSRWNHRHAEPFAKSISAHVNDRNRERPLRIGYVSPDFRDHVVGRNLLPLFAHHDHRQFQITCYANVAQPDATTGDFQKHSDRWRSIAGLSDEQAANQIRADEIDILVDLALHTAGNRLLIFARKPAPVQATFAGYPGSTGLRTIDYRLSDPYLDPPDRDESIYSEKTIRLPDSFWCYDPLENRDLSVNALPALEAGRVTFGCLSGFFKINDGTLSLWAAILRQVENSRLVVLASEDNFRKRTVERLGELGIDAKRIEFVSQLSRRAYLEKYHAIDIGLDSFPYNGHTTSLDSFWMGVPVITLVGETAVSRAGWCQLSNLGLTELAAATPEQFVSVAVELAKDLPRLSELRRTLRARMEQSPLMDAAKFARSIEAAYREMWHAWCDR